MSVITKSMAKKLAVAEVVHQQPLEPSPWPSITDLPPEVLEMILVNLDCGRNSMLPYRLVSPLWKSIIDDLLERKSLKGNIDSCPTLRTSNGWPKICCLGKMLVHNGNPFPSSALVVAERYLPFRGRRFRLDSFMSKVGSHLTTLMLDSVRLQSTENLCKTLTHLPNLKSLNLRYIKINMDDEETLGSLPVLPHLSRLELYSQDAYWNPTSHKFCAWFVGAYAEQLEDLDLTLAAFQKGQVHMLPQRPSSSVESSPMQKLRQLKIFNADVKFLQLCCSPPFLKHLYIRRPRFSEEMNLSVLMTFVDKFSNTLETLDLDIKWSELSYQPSQLGEGDVDQLDMKLRRFYDKDAIWTGGEFSATTELVFPKLTKLAIPYPSNNVESTVISKLMLPKFPVLRELKLSCCRQVFGYRQNVNNDEYRQAHGATIKEFLVEEGYWRLCSKLTLIFVWHSGKADRGNFLVFSARRE